MSTVFHVDEPGFDDLGEIVDGSHGSFNTHTDGKLIPKSIDYKFDEPALLKELSEYVNSTYDQHYGKTKIQTTEFILDQGLGIGFCVGNCIKYLQRYGKKDGYNRKDILKAIHYAIILLHTHDLEHAE